MTQVLDAKEAAGYRNRKRACFEKQNNDYPGVAQLVARLLWEQDAASSSLATWTKSPKSAYAVFGLFCLYRARLERLNATRMSVAADSLKSANHNLRSLAQLQTSLAPGSKIADV